METCSSPILVCFVRAPQYEAVREMMDDPDYYKYALGISYAIPSAETLRQRFDMIGDSLRKDI